MRASLLSLSAIVALLVAAPASATITWSTDTTLPALVARVAKASCTTGTETAPTLSTDGLLLTGVVAVSVTIEASAAMTANGKLLAYSRNPITGTWARVPDLDLTVAAVAAQTFSRLVSSPSVSSLAFVPSGIGTVTSTVYVTGYFR